MITKLTAENNELYQARFELMNQAFLKRRLSRELTVGGFPQYLTSLTDEQAAESNQILQISSLEEYFANIKTIQMFVTKDELNRYVSYPEYTSRCLMMAADEPLFEINANTRTITVPAEFKKNGIAVVGDHQAETVYFKIDKYFDYQSFYDLLQGDDKGKVVINWTFTPAGSKVTSDVQSVYAFGPSDDLQPGYLIFGWIIDNDMTKGAGTLTFSVQFYHDTNGDIDYSFNTLTATVAVGNTLNIKAPTMVKDNSTTLGLRLRNSAYRVDAIDGPAEPSWIEDLEKMVNMPFNADDTQSTLNLVAEAGIKKGVTIQYRWFATVDGTSEPVEVIGEDIYEATEDLAAADGKLYYKAVSWDENDMPLGFQLLVGTAKDDAFDSLDEADAIVIYERKSKITVNKAGRYSAQANAKVDISNGTWEGLSEADRAQVEALTRSIDSTVCTVPAASEPDVALTVASTLNVEDIMLTNETDGNEYVYISSTETPNISATVTGDNLGALAIVMLDNAGNIIGTNPAINFNNLSDADISTGNYTFARYANNQITVANNLNAQGNYKVGVINRLNNTYAIGDSTSITTSFVAPEITALNVTAADGIAGHDAIALLINSDYPDADSANEVEGNQVQIAYSNVNTIMLTDNTNYSDFDGCQILYYLQEVKETNLNELVDEDDAEVLLVTRIFNVADAQNFERVKLFMPADPGYYRIKVVTKYHNTYNESYTKTFLLFGAH